MATIEYDSKGTPFYKVETNPDLQKFDLDGDGYVTQNDINTASNTIQDEHQADDSIISKILDYTGIGKVGGPLSVGIGAINKSDRINQQNELLKQMSDLFKQSSTNSDGSITGNPEYDTALLSANKEESASTATTNPLLGLDNLYTSGLISTELDENGNEIHYISNGKKDGKTIVRYRKGDEFNSVQNLKPKELMNLRQQAYYAGYYGDDGPSSFVGPATMEDVELMKTVMTDANVSGLDWKDLMTQRASVGSKYGRPISDSEIAQMAGDAAGALQEFAANNGLKLSNKFIQKQAESVADGNNSVEGVIGFMKDNYLKTTYPAFTDEIDKGYSINDIAQPYIDTVSNILELDDVDINDPAVRKALQAKGQDGKPIRKSIWEFEEDIKKDPRWQYTDNAWQSVGSASMEVMRLMGMEG